MWSVSLARLIHAFLVMNWLGGHYEYKHNLHSSNTLLTYIDCQALLKVNKGLEYATNVNPKKDGEWKDTILGEAYEGAKAKPDEVYTTSWEAYGPNQGAVSSFLAKAIRNNAGIVVGVYATQMPPDAKPIECQALLADAMDNLDLLVDNLEFGVKARDIPPPSVQIIADKVFALYDQWQVMKTLLKGQATVEAAEDLISKTDTFLEAANELDSEYVDQAWLADKTVPGFKISLANLQTTRIQELAASVTLMFMKKDLISTTAPTYEDLLAMMDNYEKTQLVLLSGQTGARRLQDDEEYVPQKTDVAASEDPIIVKLMADAQVAYDSLKATLGPVTTWNEEEGETAPSGQITADLLKSTVETAADSTSAMGQSLEFFASKMILVVLEPIAILAPVPLTGSMSYRFH